jgi:HSP20 family protein
MIRRNSFLPSIVDEFFGKDMPSFITFDNGISSPSVNITESKDDFRIDLAAPGLDKDDFRINLNNNVLTISCEKEMKDEEVKEKYMRREFSYTKFSRAFSLPISANSEKINAAYKNGVLSVSIPKKEEAREKPSREIAIA